MAGKGIAKGLSTSAGLAPRELERDARVGRALYEIAGALGASLELDGLLELVVRRAAELAGAHRAVLFVLDERSRTLEAHASSLDKDLPLTIPLAEGWLAHAARSGQTVRIAGTSARKRELEWSEALGIRSKSAVICPLKNNLGRTIGLLAAFERQGASAFSSDDEEILSVVGKQAAVAIDNSRLLLTLIRKNQQLQQAQVQLTRRVRDLELLFELERRTAHAHSQAELARAVLTSLARSCDATGAILVLAEEATEHFTEFRLRLPARAVVGTSRSSPEFRVTPFSFGDALLAPVIQLSSPVQLDRADEPLDRPGIGEVQSVIAEPLEGDDTPLGALALVNKRGGPFTAEDLGLLRLVSANVSTAVRLFNSNRAREREERLTSIGRLLSQVVHDLKSPLTVISGYVQLMEESSEREERSRYALEILKQFQTLGAMQSEVLAFARGETRVFARKVIVDRFFEDLRGRLEAELIGLGFELVLSATPRLVAHFDSEKIMRALQNLVRNAAEAMEHQGGGKVTINAELVDGALCIEVRDNGPGIPEEIAPRLFQSFVTAGKEGGTGLGLAIVKRIVVEHGGTIELVPVRQGTCFRLCLPQPSEEEALSSSQAGGTAPQTRRSLWPAKSERGSGGGRKKPIGKPPAKPGKSSARGGASKGAASRGGASAPAKKGKPRPRTAGKNSPRKG